MASRVRQRFLSRYGLINYGASPADADWLDRMQDFGPPVGCVESHADSPIGAGYVGEHVVLRAGIQFFGRDLRGFAWSRERAERGDARD